MVESDGRFGVFVAIDGGVFEATIVGDMESARFSNKTTQISKIIADGSIKFEVSYDGRTGDNLKFLYKTLPVDSAELAEDKHLLISTDTKEVELPHLIFKTLHRRESYACRCIGELLSAFLFGEIQWLL